MRPAYEGVFAMSIPRMLTCVGFLAFSPLTQAQTPPTAYSITEPIVGSDGGTMTIYRSGAKVVMEYIHANIPNGTQGHHSFGFYDLNTGVSHSWDPAVTPPSCNVGKFSGDWGDPFAST